MKPSRATILFVATIVVLLFLSFSFFYKKPLNIQGAESSKANLTEITIGNSKLYVEKALNETEWSRGLSNRTELNTDGGMLFVFPTSEIKTFWMKDTFIPLDIIWVANKKVVGIDRMFPELNTPLSQLKRFISPSPVDMAIETNLGWTAKHGIKINDKISY